MSIIQPRGDFAGQKIVDDNRQYLEPDEVKRFFETVKEDDFWYPYFWIQFYFGCRVSEPALILKEDISFENPDVALPIVCNFPQKWPLKNFRCYDMLEPELQIPLHALREK